MGPRGNEWHAHDDAVDDMMKPCHSSLVTLALSLFQSCQSSSHITRAKCVSLGVQLALSSASIALLSSVSLALILPRSRGVSVAVMSWLLV